MPLQSWSAALELFTQFSGGSGDLFVAPTPGVKGELESSEGTNQWTGLNMIILFTKRLFENNKSFMNKISLSSSHQYGITVHMEKLLCNPTILHFYSEEQLH